MSDASRTAREIKIRADSISTDNVQLHQQARVLSSADQRKDTFMAVLAHALRGPLSGIGISAELLRMMGRDAGRPPYFAQYRNNTPSLDGHAAVTSHQLGAGDFLSLHRDDGAGEVFPIQLRILFCGASRPAPQPPHAVKRP